MEIDATKYVINPVRNRLLRKNQNWLCCICGQTGSGKSYTALKLASLIDPNFTIDNVVFTGQEFMDKINDPERFKKGTCLVWDECGVNMSARDFQSLMNKLLNKVLQTFRHKNIAVIFTVPSLTFLDVACRRLLHAYIETVGINRIEKVALVKFFNMETSARFGKDPYFHYPILPDKMSGYSQLKIVKIAKVNKELLKQYEAKRLIFTASLNKDIQSQLTSNVIKSDSEQFNVQEIGDKLFGFKTSDPETWDKILNVRNRVSEEGLINFLGVSEKKARRLKVYLDKKNK